MAVPIKNITLDGVVYEETDALVLAAPYGGPMNGRDLHNEAFEENTKYLATLPYVFCTLNHGAEMGIEKSIFQETDPIGVGEMIERTDKGIVYKIWTEVQKEYRELINSLYNEGLLTTSSTPLQRAALNGVQSDGIYKSYPIVEIAATPNPANPSAVGVIMKSLKEKGFTMADVEVTTEETKVETPAPEASETSVTDAVKEILGDDSEDVLTLPDQISGVEKSLQETLKGVLAELKVVREENARIEKSMNDIKTALPVIAQRIEKRFGTPTTNSLVTLAEKGVVEKAAKAANGLNTSGTSKFHPQNR